MDDRPNSHEAVAVVVCSAYVLWRRTFLPVSRAARCLNQYCKPFFGFGENGTDCVGKPEPPRCVVKYSLRQQQQRPFRVVSPRIVDWGAHGSRYAFFDFLHVDRLCCDAQENVITLVCVVAGQCVSQKALGRPCVELKCPPFMNIPRLHTPLRWVALVGERHAHRSVVGVDEPVTSLFQHRPLLLVLDPIVRRHGHNPRFNFCFDKSAHNTDVSAGNFSEHQMKRFFPVICPILRWTRVVRDAESPDQSLWYLLRD